MEESRRQRDTLSARERDRETETETETERVRERETERVSDIEKEVRSSSTEDERQIY